MEIIIKKEVRENNKTLTSSLGEVGQYDGDFKTMIL